MEQQTTQQANERGANDYLAGNNLNPFDWETQREQWRAWVIGYTECRNGTADMADLLLGAEVSK